MKTRKFFLIGLIMVLLSGCVVYSFYPLYTEKDLFANDILTGSWFESDDQEVKISEEESTWTFEHPFINKEKGNERDSLSYLLNYKVKNGDQYLESAYDVHLIKLAGQYFLDFYLIDYAEGVENATLDDFHLIPVHTFAKLTVDGDQLKINWFDNDWLEKLIRENKIRIHHEETDDLILLTAKPQELQKFVTKFVNSEDAFDEGLEVILQRK